MNDHLGLERTTYLVYGLMEDDEKVLAESHVSSCPTCADAVRRLADERSLVVEAVAPPAAREEFIRSVAATVHQRVVAVRRSRVRRAWVMGVAAAGLFAATVAFLSRTKELPVSRPSLAAGRVSIQRGEFWVDTSAGYVPSPGDRIRTDDVAGATIRLTEGSQFKITRGSMVEFRGERGPTAVLRLLEGEVRCDVVPDPRPFSVEAAGAIATVVGTEFNLHVIEDEPFFKPEPRIQRPPKVGIFVLSGAVEFRAPEGGALRVNAGYIALAGAKGNPWLWGHQNDAVHDKSLEKLLRGLLPPKPADEVASAEGGWTARTDESVRARINAVPWSRLADALIRYHHEIDEAVTQQRRMRVEPDVKVDLEWGWERIGKLAAELGVRGDFMQACRNKLAGSRLVEAIAEAMTGGPLSDEERTRILVPASIDNLVPLPDPGATTLARWKNRADRTHGFLLQLKEVLPADRYARAVRSVGPSFLLQDISVWVVEAETVEEAAERVARIWREDFQIPTYAKAALDQIAADYVRAHLKARESSDGERLERFGRDCALQADAEKKVSEIPSLKGDARTRAAAGSKSLLRIRVTR